MNFQEPTTTSKDGTTDFLVHSNNNMLISYLEIYRGTAEWFNSKSPLNGTINGRDSCFPTKKSMHHAINERIQLLVNNYANNNITDFFREIYYNLS